MMRKSLLVIMLSSLVFAFPAAADYIDGLAAYVEGDYKKACREFTTLAGQGDVKAQIKLGELEAQGQCGPQKNDAAARKWYRKAADQGSAEAQVRLGLLYLKGKATPKKNAAALKWYRRAAEQGDATGQWLLGKMYDEGKGVRQSDAEAFKWYDKAAAQGNAFGQLLLGELYANGRGTPQNYVQAYLWLTLAFTGEERAAADKAADIRYGIAGKMKPEEIEEAKRLAKEWRPLKAQGGI